MNGKPKTKAQIRAEEKAEAARLAADKADLESWARVFGVTFTQVRAAVAVVGPKVADVRKYLKK